MNETKVQKLGISQLSLYNPSRMSNDEIISSFSARQKYFDRVLSDLKGEKPNGRPQHQLIVGQRGMGKTTLLARLAAEIRTDPNLPKIFVPLVFAEEQYAVDRLSKFWLNCLDSLADACEREGQLRVVDQIDEAVGCLTSQLSSSQSDEEAASEALDAFLSACGDLKRRPVLFVDNLQLVFERISKQQQHVLRELLMRPGAPILIGASPSPPPASQDYGAAFYDHFKVHFLAPLSADEMKALMLDLAGRVNRPDVRLRVLQNPHRLKVLRQLTGGNPRTTVTLFFLYAEDFAPSVYGDLENLLDRVTPLYKARIEELSEQQQVIISAIANHWDPVTVKELSMATGLKTTGLNSQLDRMEKVGVVERVELFGTASKGIQIAERFFNIWFLMRSASRRQRREVEFLARFIESFYEIEDRCRIARSIQKETDLSPDRHLFVQALGETLSASEARDLKRHAQLDILRKGGSANHRLLAEMIDLDDVDPVAVAFSDLKESLAELVPEGSSVSTEDFVRTVLESRELFRTGKRLLLAQRPAFTEAEITDFLVLLNEIRSDEVGNWGEETVTWISERLASGQLADFKNRLDWESAFLQAPTTAVVEILLESIPLEIGKMTAPETIIKIESLLKPDKTSPGSQWFRWGLFSHSLVNQLDRAIESYQEAQKQDPKNVPARNNLALLYEQELGDFTSAVGTYREAIDAAAYDDWTLKGLARLLHSYFSQSEEAERLYREVIKEWDPEDSGAWLGLGVVLRDGLGQNETAESLFRKLTEEDPDMVQAWNQYGYTLSASQGRTEEAIAAFEKALEIDPDSVEARIYLGNILCDKKQDYFLAAELFEQALELEPENEAVLHNLIFLHRDFLGEGVEAHPAYQDLYPRFQNSQFAEVVQLQDALFHAYFENWGDARGSLTRALTSLNDSFSQRTKDDWFRATAVLLHLGYGERFIKLLVELGTARRLRPWFEAIQALKVNERGWLTNLAPEIRQTAEIYFDEIQKRLDALPPDTKR